MRRPWPTGGLLRQTNKYLDNMRELNKKFGTFFIKRNPGMIIAVMLNISSKTS
jgi:hypothetical protein